MMNDLIINVEKSTRMVILTKTTIGNDTENLQEKLIFKFTDTFVDGTARLEYKINGTKNYIVLTKENNTYAIPVQNVITKEGKIEMQLVITEGTDEENIPVFKSNVFYLYCNKSINAVNEAPAGYELWIETANAKLNLMDEALTEVDNLNIDANKVGTTTTIEITKKDGTTDTVEILDGEQGEQGIPGQDGYTPQKGIDYFTEQDIESLNIPTKTSQLQNDSGFLTEHQDISMKQNIEDNTLETVFKTIPQAINEVNSVAKGATQAISFPNYQQLITALNILPNDYFSVGQNLYIVTLNVPDLWISKIESTSTTYTYTTDEAFTTELATNGYVQVGYYRVSALETQKVDLTNYVQFTDYSNDTTAGVVKTSSYWGTATGSTGHLLAYTIPYSTYENKENQIFISKGTLENVITGKGLTTKSYVDGLVGDIATALDTIQGEVI